MADGMSGYATTISAAGVTGNVRNISISAEVETVDITTMSSSGGWRQFVPGIKDGGEITVEVLYDETQIDTIEGNIGSSSSAFTITFPDGSTWTGSAFITSFSIDNPQDDAISCSITLKVDGAAVFTVA